MSKKKERIQHNVPFLNTHIREKGLELGLICLLEKIEIIDVEIES